MSENTTEQTPDQEQPPAEDVPAPTGAALPEVSDDEATGYAVYDHTLLKYVSGIVTKSEATKAAKNGPAGHQLEVRKV